MRILSRALVISLLVASCMNINSEVTLSGEIINPVTNMIWIETNDTTLSTNLDQNNKFKISFNISEAKSYRFDHGGHTYIFLKPGCNLDLTINTKDFDKSIKYEGDFLEENEYLKKRILIKENLQARRFDLPNMNEDEFEITLENTLGEWKNSLHRLRNIDKKDYAAFKKHELTELEKLNSIVREYYQGLSKLTPGNEAIDFNLVDINGNIYSLNRFNDKAICIDVWASWCQACMKELPYFMELEKKYKNQEIVFIGVSIDDNRSVWEESLLNKEIEGIQLWAQNGTLSEFYNDYKLTDIPAYILIDKKGKIVKSRASKPSENLEEDVIHALNR